RAPLVFGLLERAAKQVVRTKKRGGQLTVVTTAGANGNAEVCRPQAQHKRPPKEKHAVKTRHAAPLAVRRRKANPSFKRYAVIRYACDVLRKADGPLTTNEIAFRLLQAHGIPEPTIAQVRNVFGAVNQSLGHHAGKTLERVGEGMSAQ